MSVDLTARLGPVELANPVLAAAGCAGAGRELAQFFDIARLGALVTKSIMAQPRSGRPTPRLAESASGMLNSIGLQGPGVDVFLQRDLPWLLSRGARTIVSVAGAHTGEYAEVAARLSDAPGISAVEVNLSCAQATERERTFAAEPEAAAEVVASVVAAVRPDLPVIAKLAPDGADIVEVARACVSAGAGLLAMINTIPGMVIDTTTLRPGLAGSTGGLSGPAIRPIAVRCVYRVHAALPDVPIIGIGGVQTGQDALEMLLAGASAVGVGTATFRDPTAALRIQREIEEGLAEREISRLGDIVGLAHRPEGAAGLIRTRSRRAVAFD
ncbi:dihydroorotate dehydrogenase [Allonocardiopsis opalescens]|uniref:Dihydroorotate dehydrogenase n=1 Tax=Allonocardiopsis opalescens TaxID=1144618 RepID=A0A2T0PZM9_9ACTN|nr:dihydroorotate dehydrogenase [Allonocardiopsis opalescens]PRX96976.1 dihydroorotate dehydrogenase (NAD+) catalytic subunit [Allonocardiopsis opalescens]